jgi:hypothetical protein
MKMTELKKGARVDSWFLAPTSYTRMKSFHFNASKQNEKLERMKKL